MNDDPVVAARAIEAGAMGYIAKNDDPALFADAVQTVANGGLYLHPDMARQIAFLRAGPNPDAISNLSARELEILRLLAAGRTMAADRRRFSASPTRRSPTTAPSSSKSWARAPPWSSCASPWAWGAKPSGSRGACKLR